VYSNKLVFMYVIVDSCLWYIFRLLAHALVRTRTIPNSNGDFSQSDQTIFYTVSLNFQRIVPVSCGHPLCTCVNFCVALWTFLPVELMFFFLY
jgi:hypothetical protein